MGTEPSDPTPDRQAVFEDLASRLQELHGGAHAARAAQALLGHATGSRDLVGLVEGGDRAVVYHATAHTLAAVPFDEHGLATDEAEQLWGPVGDPATWVDATAEDLDWVHPRYRWVLDSDRDSWRRPAHRP